MRRLRKGGIRAVKGKKDRSHDDIVREKQKNNLKPRIGNLSGLHPRSRNPGDHKKAPRRREEARLTLAQREKGIIEQNIPGG